MSQVVIVGGGFGGLYAAKALGGREHSVTLVDKRNFHLFQPLLYQVATGSLSPGDIASPLRSILRRYKNINVLLGDATDVDASAKELVLASGARIPYDVLIIATGVHHHYFAHPEWEAVAPGLKLVEDAQEVRRRVLLAFEHAEAEPDTEKRKSLLRFVIVGGGPTGVEMAGALAELSRATLREDFRKIDPKTAEILLVEATDRILPAMSPNLSGKATRSLERLGVQVLANTRVASVTEDSVTLIADGAEQVLGTQCIIWAAGVKVTEWASILENRFGVKRHDSGKVLVSKSLEVAEGVYVIGDLAHLEQDGMPLPGTSPCAMQMGTYVARRTRGKAKGDFRFFDKGTLAVIGRGRAVGKVWGREFGGFPAWWLWAVVHLSYLIGFDNKVLVMLQWFWNYATNSRGTRLVLERQEGEP